VEGEGHLGVQKERVCGYALWLPASGPAVPEGDREHPHPGHRLPLLALELDPAERGAEAGRLEVEAHHADP